MCRSCFADVCGFTKPKLGYYLRCMRWSHSDGISALSAKLSPALVAKILKTVYIICEKNLGKSVAFIYSLCTNSYFYCCSSKWKFFMEVYCRRRSTLWWRVLRCFYHREKQGVSRLVVDVLTNTSLRRRYCRSEL